MSEWITVSNRNKNNSNNIKKNKAKQIQSYGLQSLTITLSKDIILEKIHSSTNEIKLSKYYQYISNNIKKIMNENNIIFTSIILLGLGSLSNSSVSLLQFIIYECLCQDLLLSSIEENEYKGKFIYEPNLTEDDRYIINIFNIKILSENLKGKYKIYDEHQNVSIESLESNNIIRKETTLFFLPHCPYRLYCNLLWENWNQLDKLYLIGNSFESYGLRRFNNLHKQPDDNSITIKQNFNLQQQKEYMNTDSISIITPYITEINLWSQDMLKTFLKESQNIKSLIDLENAMCDLSLMYLSKEISNDISIMNKLKILKPTENEIDQAALKDIELL